MVEEILNLYLEKRYSPYSIHLKLGCSIKQVYHVLKQSEDAKRKNQRDIDNRRTEYAS
jgi:hypothetical protein